jgi:HKD family nuclease
VNGKPTHSLLRNTGLGGNTLESILSRGLRRSSPEALGVAVAYLSIYGARFLRVLAKDIRINNVRLVADTGDAITHPEALRLALDQGWAVRAANPKAGTFHSKMMVGGKSFSESAGIETPTWMIVGSGNLSKGGLVSNVETSLIRYSDELSPRSGIAFKELWDLGSPLTSTSLSVHPKTS